MSRENVELVQAAVGGPVFDMQNMFESDAIPAEIDLSIFDPNMEICFQPRVDDQTYSGIEGLIEGWREWLSAWSSYEAHLEDWVDAGDNVVMLVRLRGETRHDHVAIEQPAAVVYSLEGGKVVRLAFHLDPRQALEEAGLPNRSENVERVLSMFGDRTVDLLELFGGGIPAGADLSVLADDVEVVFVGLEPGLVDGTYSGAAGLVEGWQDWLAPWSSYKAEVEDLVDAGDDVVILVRLLGTTKHGGVVIEQSGAAVWTFQDGKVVKLAFHLDRRSALESIGRADLLS
jgi:ketosteroid isomerase-like protein